MSGFAKWIAGGLGWVLGGPIGAIIGFALGSLLSSSELSETKIHKKTNTAEGDFKVSLIILIACIMKADGNPKKSQLAIVKQFLVNNFGEKGALEGLDILKVVLKQPIDELKVASQINQHMNYSSKLQLIRLLFEIAFADGSVANSELILIQRISTIFRISSLDFESLKAPFVKKQDVNWAYKALEIEPNATNDDIKKAFRRMAMKYHPDKVNTLGDDIKKSATEKFRDINNAYEHLKKVRNIA